MSELLDCTIKFFFNFVLFFNISYRCVDNIASTKNKEEFCYLPDTDSIEANDARCKTKKTKIVETVIQTAQESPLTEILGTWRVWIGGWVADITTARWVIAVCGVALPLLLGFIFIVYIYL